MTNIMLADVNIAYEFSVEDTSKFFEGYATDCREEAVALELTDVEKDSLKQKESRAKDYEFYYILNHLSNMFLPMKRVFYHGVAFYINDDAYLLTASSGVGKTTQYKNMKQLHPDHIRILNGDKPILHFTDESIHMYASPWMGKERMGELGDTELKGVIILSQNKENSIRKLNTEEAIIPLMQHFLYNPDTLEDIGYVCKMTECILSRVPVWFYENTGTPESSELLYQMLLKHSGGRNG